MAHHRANRVAPLGLDRLAPDRSEVRPGPLDECEVRVDYGFHLFRMERAKVGYLQAGPRMSDEDRPLNSAVIEEPADVPSAAVSLS